MLASEYRELLIFISQGLQDGHITLGTLHSEVKNIESIIDEVGDKQINPVSRLSKTKRVETKESEISLPFYEAYLEKYGDKYEPEAALPRSELRKYADLKGMDTKERSKFLSKITRRKKAIAEISEQTLEFSESEFEGFFKDFKKNYTR